MGITVTNSDGTEEIYTADQADEQTQMPEKDDAPKSAPAKKEDAGETADDSDPSEDKSDSDSEGAEDAADDEESEETEEDEDELKADDDNEDRPKKKSGFKKRIERFQRRLSEKEREAEYWRAEALKSQGPKPEPTLDKTPQTAMPDTDQKPLADDFESIEEYVEAVTDWKLKQAEAKIVEKQRLAQAKTEFQVQVEQFQAKVAEFSKTQEDFGEVVDDASDVVLTPGLQESILSSDFGPQVMYELALNKKEFERINGLTPLAQAREIGKLEARISQRLESESSSVEKPRHKLTTKAPPPPKPLSGKSDKAAKRSIYDPELSQAEFERLREKRASL